MKKDRRLKTVPCPPIDGSMKPGCVYMSVNSRADSETLMTKDDISRLFQERFGSRPQVCFYGKPKGSLLYAGPVPENILNLDIQPMPSSPRQAEQLSFIPKKESDNGNHYSSS